MCSEETTLTRNRRDQRPRRFKVHLRPPIPRHGSHEQAQLEQFRPVGHHRADSLDHCMDHRRGHSRVQRPTLTHQRLVCQLVYVRPQRCLLAVYELRAVQEFEAEDVFDGGECGDFLSWGYYCEAIPRILSSPFFPRRGFPGFVSLTMVTVRIRTLFLGNGDKQRRHKHKRKLFVRRQLKILVLVVFCHIHLEIAT